VIHRIIVLSNKDSNRLAAHLALEVVNKNDVVHILSVNDALTFDTSCSAELLQPIRSICSQLEKNRYRDIQQCYITFLPPTNAATTVTA